MRCFDFERVGHANRAPYPPQRQQIPLPSHPSRWLLLEPPALPCDHEAILASQVHCAPLEATYEPYLQPYQSLQA